MRFDVHDLSQNTFSSGLGYRFLVADMLGINLKLMEVTELPLPLLLHEHFFGSLVPCVRVDRCESKILISILHQSQSRQHLGYVTVSTLVSLPAPFESVLKNHVALTEGSSWSWKTNCYGSIRRWEVWFALNQR